MKIFLKYLAGYVLAVSIISIIGVLLVYVSWSFDRMTWDFTQWPYEARRGMADAIVALPVTTGLFIGVIFMLYAIEADDL